jgi:hypothetical protein
LIIRTGFTSTISIARQRNKKIIRTKVDYVIREDEDEDDDSPLIELNSNFEFANMQ